MVYASIWLKATADIVNHIAALSFFASLATVAKHNIASVTILKIMSKSPLRYDLASVIETIGRSLHTERE